MKCGIVVLNYNDYEGTINFINQIRSYENIDKIIIVDNCSTDFSRERLTNIKDDKIKVILSDENKGYAAGNNIGIKYLINECNADYVIVSNPDVIVEEEAIDSCISFLDKNLDYAISTVKMVEKDNSQSSIAWKLPSFTECLLLSFPILSNIANMKMSYSSEYFNKEISNVEVVPGSFFVLRGRYIKEVNYMDERTFLYCEENILGYKFKYKGYKLAVINSHEYIHNHSVTINKNITNKINKFVILNNSRLVYVENYLRVGKLRLGIFKIGLQISIAIRKLLYK